MRRIASILISTCLAASLWIVMAPSPASACDDIKDPCGFGRCWVNLPYYDGQYIVTERPIECVW